MIGIGLLLITVLTLPLLTQLQRTGEDLQWDILFGLGFLSLIGIVMSALFRFLAVWFQLRLLLDRIMLLPLAKSLGKIPKELSQEFNATISDLAEGRQWIRHARELWKQVRTTRGMCPEDDHLDLGELSNKELSSHLYNYALGQMDMLRKHWQGQSPSSNDTDPLKTMPSDQAILASEIFVISHVVQFVNVLLRQLRTLAMTALWTVLLLLLAATSYPFKPEQLIMYVTVGLAVCVVCVIGYVLLQINRTDFVKRIASADPNRSRLEGLFQWNNLTLLSPVLLFAAQASGRLRSVFEPILELLR